MCDDVIDNLKESGDSLYEEFRIRVYDKFCEFFLDDVEKVLKLLDKYLDEISVEILIQYMLDDVDDQLYVRRIVWYFCWLYEVDELGYFVEF